MHNSRREQYLPVVVGCFKTTCYHIILLSLLMFTSSYASYNTLANRFLHDNTALFCIMRFRECHEKIVVKLFGEMHHNICHLSIYCYCNGDHLLLFCWTLFLLYMCWFDLSIFYSFYWTFFLLCMCWYNFVSMLKCL